GSVDAVIVMAALTMHGMIPGPMLLQNSGDTLYTIFAGAFVANTLMLVFALRLLRVPLPPLLLGLILGGPIETYFLQASVLYDSIWQALTRPICAGLVVLTVGTIGYSLVKELGARRRESP